VVDKNVIECVLTPLQIPEGSEDTLISPLKLPTWARVEPRRG